MLVKFVRLKELPCIGNYSTVSMVGTLGPMPISSQDLIHAHCRTSLPEAVRTVLQFLWFVRPEWSLKES